ncbi:esterase B1-like [Contarinia nasturtii]|uniref:esterase B1-like n=1 Tax=Contarinia nasturtii TaxID=265458 RepID=UPI0012D4161F|nr:esterase B1-like [Contarinia nasturtii]
MSRNCGGMIMLAVIAFLVCLINSGESVEYKIVKTKNGAVRGISDTTMMKNVSFYSFKGIPYAKAPIGELRFKAPEPVKSWAPAILNATAHGSNCFGRPIFAAINPPQSENCLFLNVYVPADVQPDEKLAVLVYIHGGSFLGGSGDDDIYGPDFIIEKRAILVTLNYRLGILGLITFNTQEYSGNMALKDQQLALKWVNENIGRFSGDPKRVTLFGESAGSTSTHYHLLSSKSRRYFRNEIAMSGTVENIGSLSDGNALLKFAYTIASELDSPQESLDSLIAFFKTVPAEKIIKFVNDPSYRGDNPVTIFSPIIEKSDAIRPFITENPDKIYKNPYISTDIMFSVCSLEILSFYLTGLLQTLYPLEQLDRNFSIPFPFKNTTLQYDSPKYTELAAEVREFYFKDAAINEQSLIQYLKLFSDILFTYGIDKAAKLHATKLFAKSYYFQFSVDSKLNVQKRAASIGKNLTIAGAVHGDDVCYIFGCRYFRSFYNEVFSTPDDEQSKVSLKTIDNMATLFTNFAKYGKPIQYGKPIKGFSPVQMNRVNFLDFTNDGLILGLDPNGEAIKFWTRIGEKLHENN